MDERGNADLVQRFSTTDQPVLPLWDLLLRYAISEDGALHHEKFYRTTVEEFNAARPAFKWRYVIALARVTASGGAPPNRTATVGRRNGVGAPPTVLLASSR